MSYRIDYSVPRWMNDMIHELREKVEKLQAEVESLKAEPAAKGK
jgi:hypothetical protein